MIFEYQAWNSDGVLISGSCEGINLEEARWGLIKQELCIKFIFQESFFKSFYKKIFKIIKNNFKKKLSFKAITEFLNNLTWMQKSGIPLAQALFLIEQASDLKTLKIILGQIKSQIESGENLNSALRKFPKYFDLILIEWITVGENTGNLESSLSEVVNWREKKLVMQQKLQKALTYPMIVLMVSGLVLWILMVWAVPSFEKMFLSFHAVLPGLTQGVIGFSRFLCEWGFGVFSGLGSMGLGLFFIFKKFLFFKKLKDQWVLKLPGIKNFSYHAVMFKVLGVLAISSRAGVPLFESMKSAIAVSQNKMIQEALEQAKIKLWEGWSLSQALEQSNYFYPDMIELLRLSEASGCQEKMLQRLADLSEAILSRRIDQLLTLLEPALMLIIGGLVGIVVLAMYAPIFQMGSVI